MTDASEILFRQYAIWQAGAEYQAERIQTAATFAMLCPGDLVEIGALLGDTTVVLAPIARKYGRKVLVIDPYETGSQDCGGEEYEFWLERTEPYRDVIEHWRLPSQNPEAVRQLKNRKIAFAFVDGLHSYEGALSDLHAVAHASIIAVDDMNMATCRLAFDEFRAGKLTITPPYLREWYILNLMDSRDGHPL